MKIEVIKNQKARPHGWVSQNIYQSQDLKCLVAVAVLVVQVGMNMYTDLKKSRQIQCLMLSVMTEKAFLSIPLM